MYAGRVVEEGTLDEIFYDPQHPYTWGLLGSLTRIDRPRPQRLPQIAGVAALAAGAAGGLPVPAPLPARVLTVHAAARGWSARLTDAPDHRDRCWLTPEEKREQREVEGQIGLEAPREVRQA